MSGENWQIYDRYPVATKIDSSLVQSKKSSLVDQRSTKVVPSRPKVDQSRSKVNQKSLKIGTFSGLVQEMLNLRIYYKKQDKINVLVYKKRGTLLNISSFLMFFLSCLSCRAFSTLGRLLVVYGRSWCDFGDFGSPKWFRFSRSFCTLAALGFPWVLLGGQSR